MDLVVKRITDANELLRLSRHHDNAEHFFPCKREEWLQWLVKMITSPSQLAVWFVLRDSHLVGYLVAISGMAPPICKEVVILYLWLDDVPLQAVAEVGLAKVEDWARSLGATRLTCLCPRGTKAYEKLGFTRTAVAMEKPIWPESLQAPSSGQ